LSNSDPGAAAAVAPTLFLSDADVAALADWPSAVNALASAYATPMQPEMVPPRSMARAPGKWLRGLSAIAPSGRHMGNKLIAACITGRRASYLISLFDADDATLHGLIDGNRITGIRTAATATVAVRLLAPARALKVAVIGSGFEAKGALTALASVLAVQSVKVFSPTPASRDRFAAAFRDEQGLHTEAVASAREAVQGADVVICAARSRDESPVLLGEWLEPGMTVVSLGSTLPEQREVDEATMARASRIVADMPEEVLHETGDALFALKAGIDVAAKMVSLADVAAGKVAGRERAEDIMLYKSVGSALQDVVISEMLLDRARAQGLGTAMPVSVLPVAK